MFSSLLFAGILIFVVASKYLYKPTPRCPECHTPQDGDYPICECGYVFEFPDEDDDPIEYGDPNDAL
ncbi:MAG: hypothetical protein HOE48_23740 [Candidatus Latescibacteria bacterium]|jgi:hypothetical protein|nr:hypothetical protein [Candidatus Latescibacterota bacterium]